MKATDYRILITIFDIILDKRLSFCQLSTLQGFSIAIKINVMSNYKCRLQ